MLCDYVKTRLHQIPLPPPTLPFPLHNTILKNSTVITKKTCRVLIVAVMGIRIKGELTGVRNLFLTPVLNFEGERLQARAGPLYPPPPSPFLGRTQY